jgi:hypothetical protein
MVIRRVYGLADQRDIKIGRGTHLMHLETMRLALRQESIGFLRGEDAASAIGEVR